MINPILLPIYHNLAIHWYGLMIVVGIIVFAYLTEKELIKRRLITSTQFQFCLSSAIIAAVLAGKIGHIIIEWSSYHSWIEWFSLFDGGFSSLGAVLGVLFILPFLKLYLQKPLLPIADSAAVYAPLLHFFGRIGCFIAGCCFGCASSTYWAVTYTHAYSLAPLYTPLHPTQLYSAGSFLIIFAILYSIRHIMKKPGQLFMGYLFLMGIERFFVDFWRNDRALSTFLLCGQQLSQDQLLALFIVICASAGFIFITVRTHESV